MAIYCEYGNEPSSFIEGGEFLQCVSDNKLLKKVFTSWNLLELRKIEKIVSVLYYWWRTKGCTSLLCQHFFLCSFNCPLRT